MHASVRYKIRRPSPPAQKDSPLSFRPFWYGRLSTRENSGTLNLGYKIPSTCNIPKRSSIITSSTTDDRARGCHTMQYIEARRGKSDAPFSCTTLNHIPFRTHTYYCPKQKISRCHFPHDSVLPCRTYTHRSRSPQSKSDIHPPSSTKIEEPDEHECLAVVSMSCTVPYLAWCSSVHWRIWRCSRHG